MRSVLSSLSIALLAGSLSCAWEYRLSGSHDRPTPHMASRPPQGSRPLVTLVVDQMGAWIADERWPLLPSDGGFARLMREGTFVRDMRYAHAVTDTAPGHSALYTGAAPRESGIAQNEVLTADGGKVSILRDERETLGGAHGPLQGSAGASLRALRVPTVADGLRAAHPEALILSLSIKDRGALFAGGRKPTAAVWLDLKSGGLVCSSPSCQVLPSWARALGAPESIAGRAGEVWRPLDPGWVASHAASPDDQPGEGDAAGLGVTFPHRILGTGPVARALRTTPMADNLLLDLALSALDAEYRPDRPTLLAVSLSANDYIGHTFGPDSWEAWDELERLDATLGVFLRALDARFGVDGYDVMLSADHGVTTMPEATKLAGARPWCSPYHPPDRFQRACGAVTRILPQELLPRLNEAARDEIGPGQWVAGIDDPYVLLTPSARSLPAPRLRALKDALGRALTSHPGIAQVFDVAALPERCPPDDDESIPALVCRSTSAQSGDLYVVTTPGSFFDPDVVVGKGSSHGTPYLYDRSVPMLVRAPGRVARGAVVGEPVGFGAFARTAAFLLGIEPPAAAHAALDLSRAAQPAAPSAAPTR